MGVISTPDKTGEPALRIALDAAGQPVAGIQHADEMLLVRPKRIDDQEPKSRLPDTISSPPRNSSGPNFVSSEPILKFEMAGC